jgi:hypothetical protein
MELQELRYPIHYKLIAELRNTQVFKKSDAELPNKALQPRPTNQFAVHRSMNAFNRPRSLLE